MENRYNDACTALCAPLLQYLFNAPYKIKQSAQEIRLRVNRPVSICCADKTYYITASGAFTDRILSEPMLCACKTDIVETFQIICNYSIYSKQNEIRNGFVTMKGGHRVGICGTAVSDSGEITNIRDITSLNIRIASERKGCADRLLEQTGKDFKGLLICGAPCSGKTTLIRDIARQLSLCGFNCSVVDERGEIAGSSSASAQNDIGMCDILDSYPKAQGIAQTIGCLAPDFVICDEIGGQKDCEAIEQGILSGVRFVATAHCSDEKELMQRSSITKLIGSGFDRIVFLKSRDRIGETSKVYKDAEELFNA